MASGNLPADDERTEILGNIGCNSKLVKAQEIFRHSLPIVQSYVERDSVA